jgi:hypothetical protein
MTGIRSCFDKKLEVAEHEQAAGDFLADVQAESLGARQLPNPRSKFLSERSRPGRPGKYWPRAVSFIVT